MIPTSTEFDEVESLVCQLLDGTLASSDNARLQNLLRANKHFRRRYHDIIAIESMLHWEFADSSDVSSEIVPFTTEPRILDFATWAKPVIALAACLVVSLAGFGIFIEGDQPSPDPVGNNSVDLNPAKLSVPDRSQILANRATVVEPQLDIPHNVILFESPADGKSSPSLASADGVKLVEREREALLDAAYGMEILRSGQGFGDGGYVEIAEKVSSWRAEEDLRVGAEFGVQPYVGMDMLRFSRMEVNVFRQQAEVSELVRVLDVRTLKQDISDQKTVVKSAVRFNQGVGIADAGTEFALSLHAIDRDGNANIAVGRQESRLISDGNPETWEMVESEIELPEGTDFVVVALSAHKEGPQALIPDLSGHYADGLRVAMAVGGEPVYGRM